jgi:hypothetical protein
MEFPEESLVGEHEAHSCVSDKHSSPAIIRSMNSLGDLVNVVSCSRSPLEVVEVEEIVGEFELCGVSYSPCLLSAFRSSEVGSIVNILIIVSLGRSESQVVVFRISSLPVSSHRKGQKSLFMMECLPSPAVAFESPTLYIIIYC